MTATPETTTDTQHHFLTGLAQQGRYAHEFARAGQTKEALEHLEAIERLIAAYRASAGLVEHDAIHRHFGLTYANYLVLPRTLLQSMDDEWQTGFVGYLDRLHEAFAHVPQAEGYKVEAATEHQVADLDEEQLAQLGITEDWYDEPVPEDLGPFDLAEWRAEHERPDGPKYYRDGEEINGGDLVMLPATDPVPHYARGRARVEPRLGGGE